MTITFLTSGYTKVLTNQLPILKKNQILTWAEASYGEYKSRCVFTMNRANGNWLQEKRIFTVYVRVVHRHRENARWNAALQNDPQPIRRYNYERFIFIASNCHTNETKHSCDCWALECVKEQIFSYVYSFHSSWIRNVEMFHSAWRTLQITQQDVLVWPQIITSLL